VLRDDLHEYSPEFLPRLLDSQYMGPMSSETNR
jgi:hypothetical protein